MDFVVYVFVSDCFCFLFVVLLTLRRRGCSQRFTLRTVIAKMGTYSLQENLRSRSASDDSARLQVLSLVHVFAHTSKSRHLC